MTQFQSVGVNGYQEIKCRKQTAAKCDHDIARQQCLFHIWMYFFLFIYFFALVILSIKTSNIFLKTPGTHLETHNDGSLKSSIIKQ